MFVNYIYFGSLGSFFSLDSNNTLSGRYQANPPHIEEAYNESAPILIN